MSWYVECIKCGETIDLHAYLKETQGTVPPACSVCKKNVIFEASFSHPKWPNDWHGGAHYDKYDRLIITAISNAGSSHL